MQSNTSQKVVVVSGGAGYVGSAIVRRLEQEGFTVAALYRHEVPQNGHPYQCDLSNTGAVTATFDTLERELGPLYAGVHAAGSLPLPKQLSQLSSAELREQFDKDVFTGFAFLSECARRLKGHDTGVLVGITTAGVATSVNTKARGAYSPVKFALQGMLVALREELASSGIRVYSVAPGVMEGGLNKGTPKAFLDMVRALIPSKTLATVDDVALKVSGLLSEGNTETELTILVAPECGTRA